ncbi:MAG: TetR/AcrR family transcriptional regulator [Acidimicrobiia bacterium]|nr:TetR/AcrR family transcriptional regulator [Acidimicrobiia bacterium]
MPRIRAGNIAEHKALTRAAILDAAIDALAERDFGEVSLGVIADYAGLPRSTLYDYFESREALVAVLIDERVPPLISDWMALLGGDTPMARLESFFVATFRMAEKHRKLTSALLGAGRRIPRDLHDEYVPIVYTITEQIRATISDGIASGDFVDGDVTAMSEALTDLLAGGIDDIVGRERPCLDVDVVISTRLMLLRRGIEVPAAQPDS